MTSVVLKARSRIAARELDNALRRFEPRVAAAFRRAVAKVRDQSSLAVIARAIDAGDIPRAIELAGAGALAEELSAAGLRGKVPFDLSTVGLGAPREALGLTVIEIDPKRLSELMDPNQFLPASRQQLRAIAESNTPAASEARQMIRRQEGLREFIATGQKVSLADITINEQGRVVFTNGRNRFLLARDTGATAIPVAIRAEQAEQAKNLGLVASRRAGSVEGILTEAFKNGAESAAGQLPRSLGLAASLDLANPEAVRFTSTYLPALIREVTDETRGAVREAVERGFTEGRPAVKIAREVRDSVGLTRAQGRAVGNFRRQLETGNLGRGKHPTDRRLSASERAQAGSIFSAGGESSGRVDRLVERYRDSLVNRRAKNIARTEVHRAHVNGQEELWRQAQARGLISRERTRRRWIVTPDDRLRTDHAAVPGMNPDGVGLEEPFQTPVGPVMAPGESGVASFDVNCRCTVALEFLD